MSMKDKHDRNHPSATLTRPSSQDYQTIDVPIHELQRYRHVFFERMMPSQGQ